MFHEATVKYFKLCRAHEEILRVGVEVCCLRTAIHNKEELVKRIIDCLLQMNSQLGKELERHHHYCGHVNLCLIACLNQIEACAGYNGQKGIGCQHVPPMEYSDMRTVNDASHDEVSHSPDSMLGFLKQFHTHSFVVSTQQDMAMHASYGDPDPNEIEDIEVEEDRLMAEMMADYLHELGDD